MIKANSILVLGIIVLFLGMVLVFVGTILQSSSKSGGVHVGGVVMIGPIPIIFGTDKSFVIIAVILVIILMILYYFLFYRTLH
jgi:uncharacterized protein (TIGR00304 family)